MRGPTEFQALAVWTLRRWWELIVRSPGIAPAVAPATAAWLAVASVTVIMTWVLWRTVSTLCHSNALLVAYAILPVTTCLAAAALEVYPFGNRL